MGRLRVARRRTAVSQGHRPSADSAAAVLDGKRRVQETDCQGSRRRVVYQGRESLTFNDVPGNLLIRENIESECSSIYLEVNETPAVACRTFCLRHFFL